jgi:hypothetical protein
MDMNTRKLLSEATNRFLDAPKRMLIGGHWVDAHEGGTLDVRRRRVAADAAGAA